MFEFEDEIRITIQNRPDRRRIVIQEPEVAKEPKAPLRLKPVGQYPGIKFCTAFPDQRKQVCSIPVANSHIEKPIQGMVRNGRKLAQPFQRTGWQQKMERWLSFQPAYVWGLAARGELSFNVPCYERVGVGVVAKKQCVDCFLELYAFTLADPVVSADICANRSENAQINMRQVSGGSELGDAGGMEPDNACAGLAQRTLFQRRDVIADGAQIVPQGCVYVDQSISKFLHFFGLN